MQPLKLISSDFQKACDAMILRPIKTLETINDKAEDEFWKEVSDPPLKGVGLADRFRRSPG